MNLDNKINQYIERHSSPESPELYELNRETHLNVLQPRMLSGHIQGKLLEAISFMMRPKTILEIGTYTGYSAICLSQGLAPNGCLHTIDKNDELKSIATKYIAKAGKQDDITLHYGMAQEIIPKLKLEFDLVFIDADKIDYLSLYELCFDKVKPGGFILADNVLWDGKVVEPLKPNDPETSGILAFNQAISEDDRVENLILPLRDGISIIRKK